MPARARAVRGPAGDVGPSRRMARPDRDRARDRRGERALARAVRAEHRNGTARRDGRGTSKERGRFAVRDLEAFDREQLAATRSCRRSPGTQPGRALSRDLRRRALGDDLPEVEHGDPVGQAEHHLHVVLDEHERDARLVADAGKAPRRARPSRRASRPEEGSSSSSTRGSAARARATSTRRPVPSGKAAAGTMPAAARPSSSRIPSTASTSPGYGPGTRAQRIEQQPTATLRGAPAIGDDEVLAHRQLREQLGALEGARQPEPGPRCGDAGGHVGAVHQHVPVARAEQGRRAPRRTSSSRRRSGR